jgi:hypothetical protein
MKISQPLVLLTAILLISFNAFSFDGEFKIQGQDYAPFNWKEGSEFKGAILELVKKACEITKYKCTLEMSPVKRGL